MGTLTFHGYEELVGRLDRAVQLGDPDDITGEVQRTLTEMIQGGQLGLPDELCRPAGDSYARRLVHHSPDHGYAVVAMVWGPSQGTALHDHDGVWCVEGVLAGEIEVTQYVALERQADRWRFLPQRTVTARVGTSGSLLPPFEYHTIANHLADAPSVTLHVYGHELRRSHVFEPDGADWYRRSVRHLGYSN